MEQGSLPLAPRETAPMPCPDASQLAASTVKSATREGAANIMAIKGRAGRLRRLRIAPHHHLET
jgi:hypothetical protein